MNFQHYDPQTESFYTIVDHTDSEHTHSYQTVLVPVGYGLVQSSTQCAVSCKKARKRNERPCSNCSFSQVKCDISPPNTAQLCAKCKRDGKKECPPYVPRSELQKPESSCTTLENATGTTASHANAMDGTSADHGIVNKFSNFESYVMPQSYSPTQNFQSDHPPNTLTSYQTQSYGETNIGDHYGYLSSEFGFDLSALGL